MNEIEAMMVELHRRHGTEGMKAIATMMHDLGSDAAIEFADGTSIPCDFLMQLAWANGGAPSPADNSQ